MYLIGHLGFGYAAIQPFYRKLPTVPLLVGTVLPDLIDKPLYYGLVYFSNEHSAIRGVIAGTRTFGHSMLFLLACFAIAFWRKTPVWLALSLGVLTHLLLDNLMDLLMAAKSERPWEIGFKALFWPLMGWDFPPIPYHNFGEQVSHWLDPFYLSLEFLGALILASGLYLNRQSKKTDG